jgi:cell division protein FtsI/penicillin-binding protein 2
VALKRATRHPKPKNTRQQAFNRFMFVIAVLVLWFGGVGARLVYLQVDQHEWLRNRAAGIRINTKKSKLPRGTIYDRDGAVLAMSVPVNTLYADATEVEDVAATAKAVAKAAGINQKEILKVLTEGKNTDRRFVPLVRGLDDEKANHINKVLDSTGVKKPDLPKYAGLHWREEQSRTYPNESLAAHVIGFSNTDGVGQAGIEQSQNERLYGAVIKRVQERDRLGRVYDEQVSEKEPPHEVTLTIRKSIQYKTQAPLEEAVRNANAKSGMAIVMDHRTGEILAMANFPTFDPNKLQSITADNLTNRAVQSVYSPGSVFKLITYGTALERKLITADGMIDSGNGTIDVAGHVFRDSHGIGSVTYSKALAHSSNVCAIKTALRVGKEGFHSSLKNFGFGRITGIELPAETKGIVRDPARWNGDSLASMSIGYEIGVTALQMTTAFATIANDGVRVKPQIIKEIRQFDDRIVHAAQPEGERVVSVETARELRKMLREVVLDGTGKRAKVERYSTAGKTGTAWKFDEKLKRVNSAKYMSSFIGFAPADNPQVTIAVIIDEPKVGGRDGGQVAAPVFSKIAEAILPELNVKPDLAIEGQVAQTEDIPEPPAEGIVAGPLANQKSEEEKREEERPRKTVPRPAAKPESDRPQIRKPDKSVEVKRKT